MSVTDSFFGKKKQQKSTFTPSVGAKIKLNSSTFMTKAYYNNFVKINMCYFAINKVTQNYIFYTQLRKKIPIKFCNKN